MAYTLGNKCAKNLCKRIVLLQLIIENVVTCFFGTQCRSKVKSEEDVVKDMKSLAYPERVHSFRTSGGGKFMGTRGFGFA